MVMPAEFDRCVKKVKGKGKVDNPYAVCRASMGSDAEIAARRKKGGSSDSHSTHMSKGHTEKMAAEMDGEHKKKMGSHGKENRKWG